MAFPTTPILDNFSTDDLAANWVQLTAFTISGGALNDNGQAYWSPGGTPLKLAAVEMYATVLGGSLLRYLEFRMQDASRTGGVPASSSAWSGYYARFNVAGDDVQLWKYQQGVFNTQIGGTISVAIDPADQIGVYANGSTIQLFKNGTQLGTDFSDSTFLDAGVFALESSATGAVFDDFGGGTPVASSQVSLPRHALGTGRW